MNMKKITSLLILVLLVIACTEELPKECNLNVASFNLRMDTEEDGEDAWSYRKEMVKGLIRFHDFDIVGTQEGFASMLRDIAELDEYGYIGVGRDDGIEGGEHSAIFYKKDRFTLLDKGDYWLSETPDEPSFGWDALSHKRICSWGKFLDNISGKEFYFFSVHYDHQGVEARRESSKLMISRIQSITNGATFFSVGDFNSVPEAEPIQLIYEADIMLDSKLVSKQPPYGTEGTTQEFKWDSPMKKRIDYIFVSKDVMVNKYGVLNDSQYGHFPSDHFPIMINATF